MAEYIAQDTTAEWLERLDAADVPCAPILRRSEVIDNEQVVARGLIAEFDQPTVGRVRQPKPAARFERNEAVIGGPAPQGGRTFARGAARARLRRQRHRTDDRRQDGSRRFLKKGRNGRRTQVEIRNQVALLVGAGDAIGAAVARRFALGGYKVCIARRDAAKSDGLIAELKAEGCEVHAFGVDARQEGEVQTLFARVEDNIGPIEVCLFNAGSNVKKPLLETDAKLFLKSWELACFAGFLVGREAARYMTKRGHGTLLFTGATASMRGGSGFAAFSSAKFGLRAVAPGDGARTGSEEYPCRASRDRCRGRQRGDPCADEGRKRRRRQRNPA